MIAGGRPSCSFHNAITAALTAARYLAQESEDEEATYRRELEAEAKGKAFSQATDSGKKSAKKGVKRPAEAEADEDKELAKIMMSKKHKQLYNKIMHGKAQKQAEVCIGVYSRAHARSGGG